MQWQDSSRPGRRIGNRICRSGLPGLASILGGRPCASELSIAYGGEKPSTVGYALRTFIFICRVHPMRFKRFLPLGKPSQLLICETDGFSLRGAVLARSDSRIVLLHQAKTEQVDMAEAVADVVGALKADGWKGDDPAPLPQRLEMRAAALPERVELVQGVLSVLQETVTDEVIIVSIDETAKSA